MKTLRTILTEILLWTVLTLLSALMLHSVISIIDSRGSLALNLLLLIASFCLSHPVSARTHAYRKLQKNQ